MIRPRFVRFVAYPVMSYRARDWLLLYARAMLISIIEAESAAWDAIARIVQWVSR